MTAHTRDHASKHAVSGEDDIHPNIDGYKLMAKELAEFITETYGLTTTKNPV